jgi:hypothetical protein
VTSEPSNDLTLKLHSGQHKVFSHPARNRVVVSGRRWGKTTEAKAEGLCEFGVPGLVWYIAPTYDMARELMWEPMLATVPRDWLVGEPNQTRMEMQTIWGCRFACKSAQHPDRLRGRGPRKILCDEFQDWDDAKTTWQEVLMPSLLTTNGRAIFYGTPKSFNTLYDLYVLGQSGVEDWASWQFRTADAPHISPKALENFRAQMDRRSFAQEFEASFETMGGRAYYAFNRQKHVGPVALDRAAPVSIAFDFNIHPATAIIGQRFGNQCRVYREVWIPKAGGEATRAAALAVKQILADANWKGEIRIYGDSAGVAEKTTGPSDHAVLREVFPYGIWCIPKQAPHIKDRVEAVNTRCDKDGWFIVDRSCVHLIKDLEQVLMDDGGGFDKDQKKSGGDLTHISDALGYWICWEWPPAARGGAAMQMVGWIG